MDLIITILPVVTKDLPISPRSEGQYVECVDHQQQQQQQQLGIFNPIGQRGCRIGVSGVRNLGQALRARSTSSLLPSLLR